MPLPFPIPVVAFLPGGRLPRAMFRVRAGLFFGGVPVSTAAAPGRPRSPARAGRVDLPGAVEASADVARDRMPGEAVRSRCRDFRGPRHHARARLPILLVFRPCQAVGTFCGVA